jgi:hypothetical protein
MQRITPERLSVRAHRSLVCINFPKTSSEFTKCPARRELGRRDRLGDRRAVPGFTGICLQLSIRKPQPEQALQLFCGV